MTAPAEKIQQRMLSLSEYAVRSAQERFGVVLDYSMESLVRLDRLLEQARQIYYSSNRSEQSLDRTIQIWGAYAGETLRRNKAGTWTQNSGESGYRQWSVVFGKSEIFPFDQVRQRIIRENPLAENTDLPPDPAELLPDGGTGGPESLLKTTSRRTWIVFGIAGLLLLGILAGALIPVILNQIQAEKAKQRADFEAQFAEYLPIYSGAFETALSGENIPSSGKFLIVDPLSEKIADLQYSLPQERQAQSPTEVSLVVQEICKIYEQGLPQETNISTIRTGCRLLVINLRQRKIVASQFFQGDEIRKENQGNVIPADNTGDGLDPQQMLDWLVSEFKE
jgi:hypothetical protein